MTTKGNWTVAAGSETMIVSDSRIPCIGEAHNEEAKENAIIMAASKDLLEALQSALRMAKFERHAHRPWHDEAKKAIEKATRK